MGAKQGSRQAPSVVEIDQGIAGVELDLRTGFTSFFVPEIGVSIGWSDLFPD
jgi:hypothetical protein